MSSSTFWTYNFFWTRNFSNWKKKCKWSQAHKRTDAHMYALKDTGTFIIISPFSYLNESCFLLGAALRYDPSFGHQTPLQLHRSDVPDIPLGTPSSIVFSYASDLQVQEIHCTFLTVIFVHSGVTLDFEWSEKWKIPQACPLINGLFQLTVWFSFRFRYLNGLYVTYRKVTHCSDSDSDSDENVIGSCTHFFPISERK